MRLPPCLPAYRRTCRKVHQPPCATQCHPSHSIPPPRHCNRITCVCVFGVASQPTFAYLASTYRPWCALPVVYGDTDMTDYNDRLHCASVRQDTPVGDPPIRTHDQSHAADHQLNVDIEKLDYFLRHTNLETLGQELRTIFRRYQPTHSRSDIIRRLPQAVRKFLVVANTGKRFRRLVDSVARTWNVPSETLCRTFEDVSSERFYLALKRLAVQHAFAPSFEALSQAQKSRRGGLRGSRVSQRATWTPDDAVKAARILSVPEQHSSGNPPAPAAQADAPHPYTPAQAAKSTSEVASNSQFLSHKPVARPENDQPIPSKGDRAFDNDFGAPQAMSEDLPDLAYFPEHRAHFGSDHFPEHPVDFGPLVEVAADAHAEESADDSIDVESGRRQKRFVEHDYVVDEDSLAEFPETHTPLRTIKNKTPNLNHIFSPANFRFYFQDNADDSSLSSIFSDPIIPQEVVDQRMSSPSHHLPEDMASQADAGVTCLVNMDGATTLAPEKMLNSDAINLCMSIMHGALPPGTANGKNVNVINSLMANLQIWRQNIVNRVSELKQTYLRTWLQSQSMLRFVDCPQQDNGFDCGIFVLRRVFVALVSALSNSDESQESAWVLHKDLDVVEVAPAYDHPGPRVGTKISIAEWSVGAPARKAWDEHMWAQQEQRILKNVEQLTLYETSVKAAHRAISELLEMRHANEKRELTTELEQRRQISDMIQGLRFRTETETQCGKEQLRHLRRARRRLQDIQRASTGFESVQRQLEVEKEDVACRIETLRRMIRA
ncbi:hypothetical protein GQ607_013052 [Colletotrichum asianum]|uniref:Ubiquitin-like protease family profile domain-containing protein n=1 Tax=Colletotrichum asianum TaxID=702518 RepID=A0A8H3ZL55_9PEZI|nr:hypothetical protein GQ607_013052 [Colletotrichum asianum]